MDAPRNLRDFSAALTSGKYTFIQGALHRGTLGELACHCCAMGVLGNIEDDTAWNDLGQWGSASGERLPADVLKAWGLTEEDQFHIISINDARDWDELPDYFNWWDTSSPDTKKFLTEKLGITKAEFDAVPKADRFQIVAKVVDYFAERNEQLGPKLGEFMDYHFRADAPFTRREYERLHATV